MPVQTPHASYEEMFPRWEKCRDFYEGSEAVKSKTDTYLPRIGGSRKGGSISATSRFLTESDKKYQDYLERALFYNGTRRTVEGLSGAIFQKEPSVVVPTEVEAQLDDLTLSDVNFNSFALNTTQELLITGRDGILVSHNGERPYWRHYDAENIVSWRTQRIAGMETLMRVVVREFFEEDDPKDEFKVEVMDQFRVLDLVDPGQETSAYRQRIYRKDEPRGEYQLVPFEEGGDVEFFAERRGSRLPFIPFVFLGPFGTAVHIVRPPLEDLVDVNKSHYQTSADLEWGAHFTALPTPVISGELASNQTGDLEIGSTVAWQLSEGASASMLEFSGSGLGALEKREESKRKLMATLGARLLEDRPTQAETFGAVALRHAGESASLRTIANSGDQGLTTAMRWHVWWDSTVDEPGDLEDVKVSLNKDFMNVKASPQEVQQAMLLVQSDLISYETFYEFIQQGEWARPGIDSEDELREIVRGNEIRLPTIEPTTTVPELEPQT